MNHFKSVSTIKLKISANKILLEAMEEYSRCISYIANVGFNNGIVSRYRLHHAVYHETRKMFKNSWSFFQLQNFIKYKAGLNGINVIKINPHNTSKICSKIGTRTKGFFHCNHCGYSLNANLNASYNLAKHNSMPDCVSADVNQPHIPSDECKANIEIKHELRDNAQRFSAE